MARVNGLRFPEPSAGEFMDGVLNYARARHVQERRLRSSEANHDKIEEHAVFTRLKKVASQG